MRILIFSDLKARGIHYSREHIRRREKAGTFPLHVDLGEGRIGWLEEEIESWIATLAARRIEAWTVHPVDPSEEALTKSRPAV